MGATLPVLVTRFERGRVGPTMAWLYAVNTLRGGRGHVRGRIRAAARRSGSRRRRGWPPRSTRPRRSRGRGPRRDTTRPMLRASGALRVARGRDLARRRHSSRLRDPLRSSPASPRSRTRSRGCASSRSCFGSSVYSFSAVLGVYLLGLALGSAAGGRAPPPRRVARRSSACSNWLSRRRRRSADVRSRGIPQWMYDAGASARGRAGAPARMGEVGLLRRAPARAVRAARRRVPDRGSIAAASRRRSTPPGFALRGEHASAPSPGSLAAGFVAIPTLGVQGTHAHGVPIARRSAPRRSAWRTRARVARGTRSRDRRGDGSRCSRLRCSRRAGIRSLMSAGIYPPGAGDEHRTRRGSMEPGRARSCARAPRADSVLYYREGVNGSVLVGTDDDGNQRWLRVGGKVDASTASTWRRRCCSGSLPAALRRLGRAHARDRARLGRHAASACSRPGRAPRDVVELEPARGRGVALLPRRRASTRSTIRASTLVLGDARTHARARARALRAHRLRSRRIRGSPGVNNLFTVDFYRRVRARLEPSGVFCQWMQLYELSPRDVRVDARVVPRRVPRRPGVLDGAERWTCCWWPRPRAGWHLIGCGPAASSRCSRAPASRRPRRSPPTTPARSPRSAASWLGAPLNRDDLPIVEYRAPRDLVTIGRSGATPAPGRDRDDPVHAGDAVGSVVRGPGHPINGTRRARARSPRTARCTARRPPRAPPATPGSRTSPGVFRARSPPARGATRRSGGRARARATARRGTRGRGQQVLQNAAAIDPTNGRIWLWIADRRRLAGDFAGAERYLARVRADRGTVVQADAAPHRRHARGSIGSTRSPPPRASARSEVDAGSRGRLRLRGARTRRGRRLGRRPRRDRAPGSSGCRARAI